MKVPSIAVLVVTVLAFTAPQVRAETVPVSPTCADIADGSGSYAWDVTTQQGSLTFTESIQNEVSSTGVETPSRTCPQIHYGFTVTTDNGEPLALNAEGTPLSFDVKGVNSADSLVYNASTGLTSVVPRQPGDTSATTITFTGITVADDDPTICVSSTTELAGSGKILDAAPDTGCLFITAPPYNRLSGLTPPAQNYN